MPLKSFAHLDGNEDLFERYLFGLQAYEYLVSQTGTSTWNAVSCTETSDAVYLIEFSAFTPGNPAAFVTVRHDGSSWAFRLQTGH